MAKLYHAKKTDFFTEACIAPICVFPWACAFQPKTLALLTWNGDSFLVKMHTADHDPRAEAEGLNGPVYLDNCMEFFLMPDPEHSPNYINWEFNQKGGLFLSLGSHRFDRVNLSPKDYMELFQVQITKSTNPDLPDHAGSRNHPADTDLQETRFSGWTLQYRIPFSFILEYFPDFHPEIGHKMRGNFYKCGDGCPKPHYGCWSPIHLPEPDFHCPDFFGDIVLENGTAQHNKGC